MNEPTTLIAEKSNRPSHEEMAAVAYLIWMSEGCPEGSEEANWHNAERRLPGNDPGNSASAGPQG